MSRIRRLAPSICPHCGAQNTLFIDMQRQLTCRLCGHRVGQQPAEAPPPITPPASTAATQTPTELRRRYPVSYALTFPHEVDPWAKSAYHTALSYVERGLYDEAIRAFRRALESQHDFIDAHVWLGRLLPDPAAKRHHFSEVISRMPNHAEAIRELMVLQGEISPEEAERVRRGGGRVATAEVPVAAIAQTQECPVCGGEMRAAYDGSSKCQSCGFVRKAPRDGDYGLKSFTVEMLRRRGQKVRWQVGERLLQCKSCGAQTLLQPQALTVRCPFCGSRGVVEADALRSFVQPDGILLFEQTQDQAQQALTAALNSRMERIKGLFINNRVASTRITPVYLPFWLFDLTLQVNVTIDDRRLMFYTEENSPASYRREQHPDSAFDVAVCGVESPPRSLIDRLERFSLEAMRPYHHELLAGATAELYTLDFEQASLLARQRVSHEMRQRYGHGTRDNVTIIVMNLVQMMYFRLALLPVYVVTVIERDGDHRSALIHGQTGQVVLGVAARPRH
jgi:DNA-directed RNA polymerase subunit RPC12/RpoP